jgi:hypothetical protein
MAVAIFLMGATAHAADEAAPAGGEATAPTDDGADWSADVTNLNYYPHAHRLYTVLTYQSPTVDTSDNSAGNSSQTNYDELGLSLAYGLGHGVRVVLGQTAIIDEEHSPTNAKNIDTSYTSSGFANPSLAVAWRFVDTPRDGYSADGTLTIVPSFGPATKTNDYSGSSNAELAGALFYRHTNCEARATLTIIDTTDQAYEGTTSKNTGGLNSNITETADLTYRHHFGQNWFGQIGDTINFPQTNNYSYEAGNTSSTTVPLYSSPYLAAGYRPMRDMLLGLRYTERAYSTSATSSQNSTTTYTNNNAWIFVGTLAYQF